MLDWHPERHLVARDARRDRPLVDAADLQSVELLHRFEELSLLVDIHIRGAFEMEDRLGSGSKRRALKMRR